MPKRTLSSLKSRWLRLAADIMKWVGCYDEALRRQTSGQNENDVLHEAHVIYENSFGGRFLSIECWKELVKFDKWKPIIAESLNQPRGRPSTSGNVESQGSGSSGKRSREEFEGEGTPTSGYGGNNRGRAMGTKAAKSRLKSTAETISTFESFSERLQLHTESKANYLEAERERLAFQREKEARRQRKMELEQRQADLQAKQLEMQQTQMNWNMLNQLMNKPNRLPFEEDMLSNLTEWFRNYRGMPPPS